MIATLPRSSGRGGDLCCAIHRGRRVKIEFIVKTKVKLSCFYRVRVVFRGKSIVAQLEPNPAMRLLILQMNAGSCALENNSLNRFQGIRSTAAKIGLAQPPNRMETDQSKMPSKTERYGKRSSHVGGRNERIGLVSKSTIVAIRHNQDNHE